MALNNLTVPEGASDEFQRILDAAYKNYQDDIENLTDAATDEIETAVSRGALDLKEIVRDYTTAAAQLSKDYYHVLRQTWREYTDKPFPAFNDDGLVDFDRVLWQTVHGTANTDHPGLKYRDVKNGNNKAGLTMDDLWPNMGTVDDAQQFAADMIRNALRAQTQRSIRRDPTNPRWARVPQGKTCAFCTMLASRGFAYTSEEAAGGEGNAFHPDCDCRIIPSWGRQTLTGYNPDKYKELYESAKRMAADAGEDTSTRNVLSWAREMFIHAFTDSSTLDPELRIPRGCELFKTLGRRHALRVDRMLNASKHPDTARLWVRYAKDYLILDPNFGGTAYFSPIRGGIFLDLKKIYKGDNAHRPYQNLFHETAHMLDQLLGGDVPYSYKQMFGSSIRNEGRRLLEREKASIREQHVSRLDEMQSYFNKHGRWKKADLVWMKDNGLLKDLYTNSVEGYGPDANMRRHIEQLKNSIEITDDEAMWNIAKHIRAESRPTDRNIDDILQAALGDAYPRSVGHDDGYFSSFQYVCGEPWAEIMDAQLANPAAYKLIEQYFPQSVTIFNIMVKEALA